MSALLLTPEGFFNLVLVAMALPLLGYLLATPKKDAATWWLALFMGSIVVSNACSVGLSSVFWPDVASRTGWSSALMLLDWLSAFLFSFSFALFAYTLLGEPSRRETRFVAYGLGTTGTVVFGVLAASLRAPRWEPLASQLLGIYVGVAVLLALIVLVRKWHRARRSTDENRYRAAAAYLTYLSLVGVLLVGFLLTGLLLLFDVPVLRPLQLLGRLAVLSFVFGMVLAYVNYSPQPTSFRAKLVGMMLAALVTAIALVVFVSFPAELSQVGPVIPTLDVRPADLDTLRAAREAMHAELVGPAWLLLLSVLATLLVYPHAFRGSLEAPLDRLLRGLRRVDAGDLDQAVPVVVRDEFGHLAEHFNAMTASLRSYRDGMEGLVESRTAALNQSLLDLQATQQQLIHQEKMASLGQLTAGIAHEIKNPLNFVTNFAEVAQELTEELREAIARGDDPAPLLDELTQNTAVIAQHGHRADAIVKGMMAHAQATSSERRAVDLNALVAEHVTLAYHSTRARQRTSDVEIVHDFDATLAQVVVAPQELGRVIVNLVINAFDAVAEHARIAPATDEALKARVTVSTERADNAVVIRVVDNGPGIPDEIRARIFEPFFTTKPTGSGTGLGLSLSYDVVTQGHGGTLTAEDAPGGGAAFVVTLPLETPA
ncbi:MAG: ATP-binding protein [Bacteroidota bacterium]